jgi:methanogenic corrinoid protein MtbC1
VSNHLARLRERRQVTAERRGRNVFYQLAEVPPQPPAGSAGEVSEVLPTTLAEFWEAIHTGQEDTAYRVVQRAFSKGVSWQTLYLQVFAPALARIGDLWESGELSVADEHLATGMVLRLMHRISVSAPGWLTVASPSALVGCVEGEAHTLGGQMVADFLTAQGWWVRFLNGSLPVEEWLDAVQRRLPDAIVLCITHEDREAALRETVERLLRWRGEQPLPLLVAGGRFFETPREIPGLDLAGTDIAVITEEMRARVNAVRTIPLPPAPQLPSTGQ